MATRTITVDDLSGKEVLTGKKYRVTMTPLSDKDKLEEVTAELDLGADSAQALWRYLQLTDGTHDTRDLASVLPTRRRVTGDESNENSTIREWARKDERFKDTVKDRGALPQDVVDAYREAHPTTPATDAS